MARVASPTKGQIAHLRTPLTAGEARVLTLMEQGLNDGWEIYVQPHLNGCRPDFVLLNPNVGIGVIEVKDWDFDVTHYQFQIDQHGARRLTGTCHGKIFDAEDPLAKVRYYKKEIYEIYCPRLARRSGFAAISAGVIFSVAGDKAIGAIFQHHINGENEYVVGTECLDAGDVARLFPFASRRVSYVMSPETADDLRSWLIEPDYSAEQREPLRLDEQQKRWATTRTTSGYRRLRGPAGSGKSSVLAARAAILAQEGKDVLVVSFNITLLNYLRDLYSRAEKKYRSNVTWMNFSLWCRRTAMELGIFGLYGEAWHRHFEHNEDAFAQIPKLIDKHINSSPAAITMYDAILVDEGQDFDPFWWNLLRKVCRNGGEMLFVADITQDIYGTGKRWTDSVMEGAGFRGRWVECPISYRMPRPLITLAAEFAEAFLPVPTLPRAPERQGQLEVTCTELRWVQVDEDAGAQTCFSELMRLIRADSESSRAMVDLTLLTDSVSNGCDVVRLLNEAGVKTVESFAVPVPGQPIGRGDDRRKKLAFWKGDARVKVCTIHSFKGWEGRLLVLYLSRNTDRGLGYVGLTRLKDHPRGSCLTVVCADRRMKEFGRSWPEFIEVRSAVNH